MRRYALGIPWKSLPLVLFCLFVLVMGAAWAAQRPGTVRADPDVEFRWAFAAMSPAGGNKAVPVTGEMTLKSGDQLKMMIELRKRCFVYVFHYNQQDGLKLLFPYTLRQFDGDYRTGQKYFIPHGDAWFRLDKNQGQANAGQESFYLVASAKRLIELEKDYLRCESGNPGERAEAVKAVLDRIRALRREHREFSSPAERPVPIGGAVREIRPGENPKKLDISSLADEIASSGFIARTYTIEHK